MAVDASGDLAVGDDMGNFQYFAAPLSAASTPAATLYLTNRTLAGANEMAFGPSGDLFVADFTVVNPRIASVDVFTRPFKNGDRPSWGVDPPVDRTTIGIAFDPGGTLYTTVRAGAKDYEYNEIAVFPPPYKTASAVWDDAALRTMWSVPYFLGSPASNGKQLFIGRSSPSQVQVYTLPFSDSSTPAFSIPLPSTLPYNLVLDAAGNLYLGTGLVSVYKPPFSATSVPALTLDLGHGSSVNGLTIGP